MRPTLRSLSRAAWLLALLALALPRPVGAAPRPRVGVLDLRVLSGEVKDTDASYLTEVIRGTAARTLGSGFSVITRDNLLDLLRAAGKSLEDCSEAGCATEYGRAISADYVITGEVQRYGDEYKVALRLHRTSPPELVASVQWGAPTLKGLERGLADPAARLLGSLGRADAGAARDGVLFLRVDQAGVRYDIDDGLRTGRLAAGELTEIRLPLRDRPYRLQLHAEGHYDYRGEVLLQGERRTHTVDHRMVARRAVAPAAGEPGLLDLSSTPANAEVFVDGEPRRERTPVTLDLPPGPHLIEVRRKLYRTWAKEVTIRPSDITREAIVLEEDFGALRIEVQPPEAEIYLDGERVGTGRFEEPQYAAGGHTLRVVAPQYHPSETTVFVERGSRKDETVRLRPAFGSIALTVRTGLDDGSGAEPSVYVDGGPTPARWASRAEGRGRRYETRLERVSSGSHDLEVQLPRHGVWSQAVTVEDGETTAVEGTLDTRFGTLRVTSEPPGAEVRLDGRPFGRTPLERPVDVGTHELEVVAPEAYYIDHRQTVAVTQGAEVAIEARLEKRIGGLTIATQPPGAELLIDGRPVGRSPVKVSDLLAGTRRIEARLEGYTPKEIEAEVREGEARVIRIELDSLGSVEVVCAGETEGVTVALDDQRHEGTRHRFQGLADGRHHAVCRSPRGHSAARTVTTRAGTHQQVELDLTDPEVLRRAWQGRRAHYIGWGTGLIVGGAAAAGVGGYFLWKAGDEHDQAKASLGRALLATDRAAFDGAVAGVENHQDSRDTSQIVGWSLVGGAAALVAAGVTVLALMPGAPEGVASGAGPRPATGFTLGVGPLPGGAALELRGPLGR